MRPDTGLSEMIWSELAFGWSLLNELQAHYYLPPTPGHARVGVGVPVRAAHGPVLVRAEVGSADGLTGRVGAHRLEEPVLTRDLLPQPIMTFRNLNFPPKLTKNLV